jgi:hypothetical protein
MEDVQAGVGDAEGDLLPGERLAEPDLAPGGEHVAAGRDDSHLLILSRSKIGSAS